MSSQANPVVSMIIVDNNLFATRADGAIYWITLAIPGVSEDRPVKVDEAHGWLRVAHVPNPVT